MKYKGSVVERQRRKLELGEGGDKQGRKVGGGKQRKDM